MNEEARVATGVVELSKSAQQAEIAAGEAITENEHRADLCRYSLFLGLDESERREIADCAKELCYSAGEIIFVQNDPVRHVFLVAKGIVKVTQISEDGKETLLRLEHVGGLVDDVIGSGLRHPLTAHALQDCKLLVWDTSIFEVFARRTGAINQNAAAIMRSRLRILQKRFCDVATRPVPQRLARLVIYLAEKAPGSYVPVELSREELAQMAGTSLFTVSRLLCAWADLEIISAGRKEVVIEDFPRLLELAQAA